MVLLVFRDEDALSADPNADLSSFKIYENIRDSNIAIHRFAPSKCWTSKGSWHDDDALVGRRRGQIHRGIPLHSYA